MDKVREFLSSFRTPAGAISALSTVVAVLGTVGILDADLSGALQSLLAAILGVIVAIGHTVGVSAVAKRSAVKHLNK